jgi:hypothetical protein
VKVKVLHDFTDKITNKRRKKDEIIDITEKRFKEINSAGFGKLVNEVEKTKKGEINNE